MGHVIQQTNCSLARRNGPYRCRRALPCSRTAASTYSAESKAQSEWEDRPDPTVSDLGTTDSEDWKRLERQSSTWGAIPRCRRPPLLGPCAIWRCCSRSWISTNPQCCWPLPNADWSSTSNRNLALSAANPCWHPFPDSPPWQWFNQIKIWKIKLTELLISINWKI